MRYELLTSFIIFFAVFAVLSSSALALSCAVRSGNCNIGETCLFSMWNETNAHAGECGYYSYSVCCNIVTSSSIKTACAADEGGVVSLFAQNNSHVERYGYSYVYSVCAKPPLVCAYRASCLAGEEVVVSINNETNAHVANTTYYSNKICCTSDITAPTISGESINATVIKPNHTVRLSATITDDLGVSSAIVTVRYPNSTSVNFTMTNTTPSSYLYDFNDTNQTGTYLWTYTYANDTSNNWTTSATNKEFKVKSYLYDIAGRAVDAQTGELIPSGTVIAIVKENGDNASASFTNGLYSFKLGTSVNSSENKFTVGLIINGSNKLSYYFMVVGHGSYVAQTQKCSTKLWSFGGRAVDTTGSVIASGDVTVSVTEDEDLRTYTNTTGFSGGSWSITLSPCLISGKLYMFQFIFTSDSARSYMFLKQVAK